MLRIVFIILILMGGMALVPGPVVAVQDALPEEGKHKIDMNPFTFAMQKRGKLVGKVTVQITLEVQEASKVEFIKQRVPQVRSDFNLVLSELSKVRFDLNRPIDPELLQQYLTPYADYRMGKDMVKVYIKQALIEPLKR